MFTSIKLFNDNQKKIEENLVSEKYFTKGIQLLIEQSHLIHPVEITDKHNLSYENDIWEYTSDQNFRIIPDKSINSIAWHLWHCARIEDMTLNTFICKGPQIFESHNYYKKLNVRFIHTGNDMDINQMKEFNEQINISELRKYRIDIWKASIAAFNMLTFSELKNKVSADSLLYLSKKGYVQPSSKWLLDFWGRKSILGIIKMPLTRHIILHINKSKKLINKKAIKHNN